MTPDVLTTSGERPVAEVTKLMVQARVGSAVVMQGAWLIGILTERDVLRAAASGTDLTTSPVSAWMTRDPTTAGPDIACDEALDVMLNHGFRHLPRRGGPQAHGHRQHPRRRRLPYPASLQTHVGPLSEASDGAVGEHVDLLIWRVCAWGRRMLITVRDDRPLGVVGRPDADPLARLDAERQQAAGDLLDGGEELRVVRRMP